MVYLKIHFQMMILIDSKRKKYENISKQHPDAIIADVTSHAQDDLIKLSPFYPHGGIRFSLSSILEIINPNRSLEIS